MESGRGREWRASKPFWNSKQKETWNNSNAIYYFKNLANEFQLFAFTVVLCRCVYVCVRRFVCAMCALLSWFLIGLDCAVFVTTIWTSYFFLSTRNETIQSNSMKIGWALLLPFRLKLIKLIQFKLNQELIRYEKLFCFPHFCLHLRQTISDCKINFRNHNNAFTCFALTHSTRCNSTFFVWLCVCCCTRVLLRVRKTLLKRKIQKQKTYQFHSCKNIISGTSIRCSSKRESERDSEQSL